MARISLALFKFKHTLRGCLDVLSNKLLVFCVIKKVGFYLRCLHNILESVLFMSSEQKETKGHILLL